MYLSARLVLATTITLAVFPIHAQTALNLQQVLQRVVDNNPALPLNRLDIDRASLERDKVLSQLGWQLGAQAKVSNDVNAITFSESDSLSTTAQVQRQLTTGGTIGINALLNRDDINGFSFSPINPSYTSTIDVQFRQPLFRGLYNPAYVQSLTVADLGVQSARLTFARTRDDLARTTIDLFYGAVLTQARLVSAREGIERSQRLLDYLKANERLGLAEEGDILQAQAQLGRQETELKSLRTAWAQQQVALNQVMQQSLNFEFFPDWSQIDTSLPALDTVQKQVETYNPTLQALQTQLDLVQTTVERLRDSSKDQLDLVLSGGGRALEEDAGTALGNALTLDIHGASASLEYRRALDKRGSSAALQQAQLDRQKVLQQLELTRQQLHYQLGGLLAELTSARFTLDSARNHYRTEQAKMEEANKRYRDGRITTANLIQFENDLRLAEFTLQQQQIEQSRKRDQLNLMTGALWQGVDHAELTEKE